MKKVFLVALTIIFTLGNFAPSFVSAKTFNDPHGKHWSFEDIGAYEAWDITTGSSDVVVAVIDNGFDANHPDLKENVWKNIHEIADNKIDDDNNGYIDDVWGWNFVPTDFNGDGKTKGPELLGNNDPIPDVSSLTRKQKEEGFFNHGTLVAGLIGAVGNNKKDMVGMNWKVRLMNLKVLSNNGAGNYAPLTTAIKYAVDNGADVINISAVGSDSKDLKGVIDYAYNKGVVVVAAAGNNGTSLKTNPLYPACSDSGSKIQKVLGVSAIDESHRLATFSNYGSNCVDITAPGVDIGSLNRYDPEEGLKKTYSDGWNGTSFSTPLVSGAAALVKALQPEWKASQIYDALLKNTHKTPTKDEAGYKNMYGAGLLQIDKALAYALAQKPVSLGLRSLGLFDAVNGSFLQIQPDKKVTTSSYSFLRKVTTLEVYKSGQNTNYLTVRPFQGENQVTLYSSKWEKTKRFTVPLEINANYFVDTFSAGDPQLLVVPSTDANAFVLYSLAGKKMKEAKLDITGTIITVNVIASANSSHKDIAVLSKDQNKYFIEIFDGNLTKKSSLSLPSLGTVTDLEYGDVDGDGVSEYVLLSQKGSNATVNMVDKKAKLIRQFSLSNTVLATDTQLVVGDFTSDKKDDILTLDKNANTVILWKNTGEKLNSFEFSNTSNQLFSLIPIY